MSQGEYVVSFAAAPDTDTPNSPFTHFALPEAPAAEGGAAVPDASTAHPPEMKQPPGSNPTANNGAPANPAAASAGGGSGVGGVSTPAAQGGGSSGGGGGGNTGVNQLVTLANEGAFAGPAFAANAAKGAPQAAQGPMTPPVPAKPDVSQDFSVQPANPAGNQAQHGHHHGLTVQPGVGPTIGDPPITASEGVAWSGQVATITDNDGDGTSGSENITGTINWGDGNSSPFYTVVPEGGSSPAIYASHTWTEKGTYTVTITATDSDGGQSQASETASVADAPLSWPGGGSNPSYPSTWTQTFEAAPSVTAPASQINTEGDSVSLPIHASDSGGDTLSYDALDLPPGVSINASTGVISGTVAYGAAEDFDGSYTPTVLVDDGHGGSAQTSFSWTINQAQVAPVLTNPGSQTNLRGDSVSLQLNATQVDSDPISYDASNLPTGLSIDPDTGIISGTVDPSATLVTPYAVTVTATDDSTNLSASQIVQLDHQRHQRRPRADQPRQSNQRRRR